MLYEKLLNACYMLKECTKDGFPENGTKVVLGESTPMEYHKVPDIKVDAFIFENDEKVIIAIGGTKDLEDLLIDIRIQEEEDEVIGTAHQGFLSSCNRVLRYIKENINTDGKEVVIFGHSLGGAVCKLLSMKMRVDKVYTFGEPNSCKKKRKVEGTEYIRVVNQSDIVCRIAFFYNHGILPKHETVIYIDRHGDVIINPSRRKIWRDIFISRLWVIIGKERPFDAFRDHILDSYIDRLNDIVKSQK